MLNAALNSVSNPINSKLTENEIYSGFHLCKHPITPLKFKSQELNTTKRNS